MGEAFQAGSGEEWRRGEERRGDDVVQSHSAAVAS
jgi:hypothetical protein